MAECAFVIVLTLIVVGALINNTSSMSAAFVHEGMSDEEQARLLQGMKHWL